MCHRILYVCFFLISTHLFSQELLHTYYFDFGLNDDYNGLGTVQGADSPLYWNNVLQANASPNALSIRTENNKESSIELTMQQTMQRNGIRHGGLMHPEKYLLGDFAVAHATHDFFYTDKEGVFILKGLQKKQLYKFYFLATSKRDDYSITNFSVSGMDMDNAAVLVSQKKEGDFEQNKSTIVTSKALYPDEYGKITIRVSAKEGKYAFLNAMKMEELKSPPIVPVTKITLKKAKITQVGQFLRMQAKIRPKKATVSSLSWQLSDTTLAKIDHKGVLYPKKNGVVTVTARHKWNTAIYDRQKVVIKNQVVSSRLVAIKNKDTVYTPMQPQTNASKIVTGKFETYTYLTKGQRYYFSNSDQLFSASSVNNRLTTKEKKPITVQNNGVYRVSVNYKNLQYQITPVQTMSVITAEQNATELRYDAKNDAWSGLVEFKSKENKFTDFYIQMNQDPQLVFEKNMRTNTCLIDTVLANRFAIKTATIPLRTGTYIISFNPNTKNYFVKHPNVQSNKISVMGSSVADGHGAINKHGYAYHFTNLLNQRFENGIGNNWQVSNISIGGDTTVKVLTRWERDLITDGSHYVVFGLSLGNEGVLWNGIGSFDQFKSNMEYMISKARAEGKIPIIVNNYAHGLYKEKEYALIKKMNLFIHQWDVPSINVLGAIDDETGKWSQGYVADVAHPNTAGHKEFFSAFVPSMFDALKAEKPLPIFKPSQGVLMEKDLRFTPEGEVHSYTITFSFKGTDRGKIMALTTSESTATLELNKEGFIVYTSSEGERTLSLKKADSLKWNELVLTHYHANGSLNLYLNKEKQFGIAQKMELKDVVIESHGKKVKQFYFYRAAMNQDEIELLNKDNLLKSSLELYAPLKNGSLENFAWSLNTLQ